MKYINMKDEEPYKNIKLNNYILGNSRIYGNCVIYKVVEIKKGIPQIKLIGYNKTYIAILGNVLSLEESILGKLKEIKPIRDNTGWVEYVKISNSMFKNVWKKTMITTKKELTEIFKRGKNE